MYTIFRLLIGVPDYSSSESFREKLIGFIVMFKEKIRTRLDLLSIPQSGGKHVKTFRWDHGLQLQNLFIAFKQVIPLW